MNKPIILLAFVLLAGKTLHALNKVSLVRYLANGKELLIVTDSIDYKKRAESYVVTRWSLEKNTLIWETAFTLKGKRYKSQHWNSPLDMIVMNDGKTICVTLAYYGFAFFDLPAGKMIRQKFIDFDATYGDSRELLGAASFSKDRKYVAVTGEYSLFVSVLKLQELEVDTAFVFKCDFLNNPIIQCEFGLSGKSEPTFMKFSNDGKNLFIGDQEGYIYCWAMDAVTLLPNAKFLRKLSSSSGQEFTGIWSIDLTDTIMITSSYSLPKCGQLQLWRYPEMSLLRSYSAIEPTTHRRVLINPRANMGVLTGDLSYVIFRIAADTIQPLFRIYFDDIQNLNDYLSSVDFPEEPGVVALGVGTNVFFFNYGQGKITGSVYKADKNPDVRNMLKDP